MFFIFILYCIFQTRYFSVSFLTMCVYCFNLFPLLFKIAQNSILREGRWLLTCSLSADIDLFSSSHDVSIPPTFGVLFLHLLLHSLSLSQFLSSAFSPLSFCLASFRILSWDVFPWVFFPYLLSLSSFQEDWYSNEGSIKCYFAPGRFLGDYTCLWSCEEGAQVGDWAMEGKTSKEDGYDLDKIKGGGEHFRVTEAVETKVWGFYQGKRDERGFLPYGV